MKYSTAICVAALAGSVVASPIVEANHHQHKRALATQFVYVTRTIDPNGNEVESTQTSTPDDQQQQQGNNNGFQQANAAAFGSSSSEAGSSSSPAATSSAVVSSSVAAGSSSVETSSPPASSSGGGSSSSSSSSSPSSSSGDSSSSGGGSSGGSSGGINGDLKSFSKPTKEFKDGEIDCSDFPSGQGVISLDHLGFGGWSGIYDESDKSTGGSCTEGKFCSYACQAGMSKTQWPSEQPGNGVSVGGLKCKNGKLYRTNKDKDNLCEWGAKAAKIVSKLDKEVSICRTDYPGTENMVLPTVVEGGGENILTVVEQATYYKWQGKPTSAQFYVNNAGVNYKKGCQWGDEGSGIGNWAPLEFGAGSVDGASYLSLIPNPNNKKSANFNVKIEAGPGASLSGNCKYENGKFVGGDENGGCTVTVTNGEAHFVLYD